MSTKEKIYDALVMLGLPLAYADSDINELPRISYSLLYNKTIKASNLRHTKMPKYQVDYWTNIPEDVENSEILDRILDSLEQSGLNVTEFKEVVFVDERENRSYWHYYTEVS